MKGLPLVDLTRQTRAIEPELCRGIRSVLARGQFILGKEVASFEKEFASVCHARYAVGVASGTDALELSLRVSGVGPGDLVATVSFTFLATVDAILHVGAQPLFIDIDPLTYTMNPKDLEEKLEALALSGRRRIRAVIAVHLFGHPCDMDGIAAIARRFRLAVIEDAAQAAGARYRGKPVGSFGKLGCFSFFPTKNLGAFGDGGMVVTNSKTLAEKLRTLRVHGRAGRQGLQKVLGRNSRLDELQAAVLQVKLRHLSKWVACRRRIARQYAKQLSRVTEMECPSEVGPSHHAYHLYVIRARKRDALQAALKREGIAAYPYYGLPVHRQPLHRVRFGKISLPHTAEACREVLALPLFPEMTQAEVDRVCRAISRFYR